MKVWQLIVDEKPLRGSWNMAVDDYLFRSLGKDERSYLRFYQWERPTVSLGYSQQPEKVVNLEFCFKNNVDIVRRMTGGKLVLHHREVTYSICSSDSDTFTTSLKDSYRLISLALIRGLEKMGLEPCLAGSPPSAYAHGNLPCFSYPARDEIEVGGRKIIGSAQKRESSRFLQHGSIPLEGNSHYLESISFLQPGQSRARMTTLSEALGRKVSFAWAVDHFIEGFAEFFNVSFERKLFSVREREAVAEIQRERYENRRWTFH